VADVFRRVPRQQGDAVVGLLPVRHDGVTEFEKGLHRHFLGGHLDLLQTEHVRLLCLEPGTHLLFPDPQ
jgi:hypothetical protein